MPRRSLKPQLNQIRAWVHQARTDAWIAHQLEISATELREFRKQYELSPDDENAGSNDIDLRDILDIILRVKASVYSIEAANPRHQHEWRVWQDVKLPDGKSLMPGVIGHATVRDVNAL